MPSKLHHPTDSFCGYDRRALNPVPTITLFKFQVEFVEAIRSLPVPRFCN